MITRLSVAEIVNKSAQAKYICLPFFENGIPIEKCSPRWGMTLRAAGSMRFRWDEENKVRDQMLAEICGNHSAGGVLQKECHSAGGDALQNKSHSANAPLFPVPIELIHSKIIYCVEKHDETLGKQGDAIITKNHFLLPAVTVADCVPIFFYDKKSGAFGVAHSGWKGTGIASDVVCEMCKKFDTSVENILVAIGPHIHKCCYFVDEERADYFVKNFGAECVTEIRKENLSDEQRDKIFSDDGKGDKCDNSNNCDNGDKGDKCSEHGKGVKKFWLSLETANIISLKKIGVKEDNITVASDCTCCNEMFGSFRRQTCGHGEPMTVQAAFCGYLNITASAV